MAASQTLCLTWLVAVQAPVNGPFVLTTQSLTSFIAQQQQWSSVYRHCATGCFAVGVAIILFKVCYRPWFVNRLLADLPQLCVRVLHPIPASGLCTPLFKGARLDHLLSGSSSSSSSSSS